MLQMEEAIQTENYEKLSVLMGTKIFNLNHLFGLAARSGDFNLVKHLSNNPKVNIDVNFGVAFCFAVQINRIDIVRFLIQKNINIRGHNYLALRIALDYKHIQLIRILKNAIAHKSGYKNLKLKKIIEILKINNDLNSIIYIF